MIARVYGAINAVSAALSSPGIAKERLNARDDYLYRSIDDVLNRLSPLLAEHRLCILPRVLERTASDRTGEQGELLVSVTVRCAFTLVSVDDGSSHVIEAYGEALDASDKGTAKAMQSAYKYAVLQAFCIPVPQVQDADARSHRLRRDVGLPEPDGGWPEWGKAFEAELGECTTLEAVRATQDARRPLLAALARDNADLYQRLGDAIARRREEIAAAKPASQQSCKTPRTRTSSSRSKANQGSAHA